MCVLFPIYTAYIQKTSQRISFKHTYTHLCIISSYNRKIQIKKNAHEEMCITNQVMVVVVVPFAAATTHKSPNFQIIHIIFYIIITLLCGWAAASFSATNKISKQSCTTHARSPRTKYACSARRRNNMSQIEYDDARAHIFFMRLVFVVLLLSLSHHFFPFHFICSPHLVFYWVCIAYINIKINNTYTFFSF